MSAHTKEFEQALELDNLDELEELLVESTTRTGKASTVSDLDDLDALLEESTVLASAKRAKAQGRKLTEQQQGLLEANHLAAEAELWVTQSCIAHITVTGCVQCHTEREDFAGWYAYQIQRKGKARRLLRVPAPEDALHRAQYVSRHIAGWCPACLVSLPVATHGDIDLLETLAK